MNKAAKKWFVAGTLFTIAAEIIVVISAIKMKD